MQLNVPADIEALINKRLSSGALRSLCSIFGVVRKSRQ